MISASVARMPGKLVAVIAFIGATAVGMSTAPKVQNLCEGFVPENSVRIPVGANESNSSFYAAAAKRTKPDAPKGGLTEQQFNDVMDRMEKLYGPVVAQHGGTLKINRLWKDSTVNASAQRFGTDWVLNMYGGLARHPQITFEGMSLVICHEMGHHLGGAPKINDWTGDNWASNEGAADYFATLKCLRNFFAEDDNKSIVASAKIDPTAAAACQKSWKNDDDVALCERISLAGSSVSYLFQDLSKDKTKPEYATPDTNVVTAMDDSHPATQCRMDTYFAGDLCTVDKTVAQSDTDYKEGSCVEGHDDVGFRPRCWFFPGN